MQSTLPSPPSSILIVGSGVFGLSTALALAHRPCYACTRITLLDASPFPNPHGSSIDTSRIVRADYATPAYASLAASAQELWRDTSPSGWGGEGRYDESGLVLVAEKGDDEYVRKSLENVRKLATKNGNEEKVRELKDRREIERVVGTGGWSGEWGYINRSSGWADAEAAMKFARRKVEETGRVQFRTGEAKRLLQRGRKIVGVELGNDNIIQADLVMLATGAWTGALVDLRGRAEATGQVLAYMDITQDEQDRLEKIPVLLNTSTGLFIIPPRNRLLKVARHGYGYTNPQRIPHPNRQGEVINISTPSTGGPIPAEGESACRQALVSMLPHLASRPFCKTRICWYTDTPTGDFIITHHPEYDGLFLATGGSGHAFKFLPVIGEKIVDAMGGRLERELEALWAWREGRVEVVVTEDGSRGGRRGMVLGEEMGKGERSRL